jgi:O-succinylbenzoate synthase
MEKIEKELAAGYRRIKIKIKPGWDVEAVERVRARFGNIPLQVDANAAYSLDDAELLARLDPFDLLLIEQPLDYDDVMDHAVLQRRLTTPVCLDESVHTVRIARDAIEAQACRIINIKPGRVGGHQTSIELHDLCAAHGIPVWHGASKRYYQPDLIDPPIDIAKDGTIAVPTAPGIGVNIVRERIEKATLRHVSL